MTEKRRRFNNLDNLGDVKRNLARATRHLFKERKALPDTATEQQCAVAMVRVNQTKALVQALRALGDIMRDAELEQRLERLEARNAEPASQVQ